MKDDLIQEEKNELTSFKAVNCFSPTLPDESMTSWMSNLALHLPRGERFV